MSGGALIQQADRLDAPGDDPANWTLVAGEPADEQTLADLEFAWRSLRAVKSNAILLADHGASVGIGMGQVNRVDSVSYTHLDVYKRQVLRCPAPSPPRRTTRPHVFLESP